MFTDEMRVAIEKSLPAVTAGALTKRIELIDKLEAENIRLEKENRLFAGTIDSMRIALNEKDAMIHKNGDLSKREFDLERRERNLEMTSLKQQVDLLLLAKKDIFDLVTLAFRNPRITTFEAGNIPIAIAGGNTGSGYVGQGNLNKTKTITEE